MVNAATLQGEDVKVNERSGKIKVRDLFEFCHLLSEAGVQNVDLPRDTGLDIIRVVLLYKLGQLGEKFSGYDLEGGSLDNIPRKIQIHIVKYRKLIADHMRD